MKIKRVHIVVMILLIILVTGCTDKETVNNSNGKTDKISEEDIEKVKELSFDDIKDTISDRLNDYIDEYDYLTITNIDFIEDKLLVDPKNEIRKFNNIELNLDIELNSEKSPVKIEKNMSSSEKERKLAETIDGIDRKLIERLNKEKSHEFSKINNTHIRYIDNINKLEHTSEIGHIRDSETMILLRNEESEEEKAAIKEIFNYVKEYKDIYELNRFGIENNLLIMEFMNYESNQDNQKIEDFSKELDNMVSQNESILKYIDNKAKDMKVIFNNGEAITFEYKIDL